MKVVFIVFSVAAVIVTMLGIVAKQKSEKYYKYSNSMGELEKQYTPLLAYKVANLEIASEDQQIEIAQ